MDADLEQSLEQFFEQTRDFGIKKLDKFLSNLRNEKPDFARAILFKLQKDEDKLISSNQLTLDRVKKIKQFLLQQKSKSSIEETIKNDIEQNYQHLTAEERSKLIEQALTKFRETEERKKTEKKQKKEKRKLQTEKTDEELLNIFKENLGKQLSHKSPEERETRMKEEIEKYKKNLARRHKSVEQLVEDEKLNIAKELIKTINENVKSEELKDLIEDYFSSLQATRLKLDEDMVLVPDENKKDTVARAEEKKDGDPSEITQFWEDVCQIYDENIELGKLKRTRNEDRYHTLFTKLYNQMFSLIVKTVEVRYSEEDNEGKKEMQDHLEKKYGTMLRDIFEEHNKLESKKTDIFNKQYEQAVKQFRTNLEDGKIFNQRMEEKRKELEEIKYNDSPESMNALRKVLIEQAIKSKKEFLGIVDEQDVRNFEANKEKMRTFEPGKEPIVNALPPVKEEEYDEEQNDNEQNKKSDKKEKPEFTHDHPGFVNHESLAKSNFKDMDYYYKARTFYLQNPQHLKPYINLLYWDSAIKAVIPSSEDIQKINEQDDKAEQKRAIARQKRLEERKRVADEKLELEKINNELTQLQTYIDDGKLTLEEANEQAKPLIARRDIINPPQKSPEQLLADFSVEVRERFAKIENVYFEKKNIISAELAEYAKLVKREITKDRKLREERAERLDELKKNPAYQIKGQPNMSKINEELERYFKIREKELNDYFIPHGIDPKEHDDVSIKNARTVFADYNKHKNTEAWKSMDADMKIEYMRAKYPAFYDSFPIIVKFMVQQDKFEIEAFKRFLEKCRTNVAEKGANPYSTQIPKKGTRRLTASEEKWLENQAYYARYLVEEYRKNPKHHAGERDSKGKLKRQAPSRLSEKEGKWIFTTQLDALRKEMMDFRQNFEKVAEELKEKHDDNDMKLIMEYIEGIKEGKYELTEEEQENIAFAVEQIVGRTEELKKKIKQVKTESTQELVNVDRDNFPVQDEEQEKKEKEEKKKEEKERKEREQQIRKANKARIVKLHRKAKQGPLSGAEKEEYHKLKQYFGLIENIPEERVKKNKLDAQIGCHCLQHWCQDCNKPLTVGEQRKYDDLVKLIEKKSPESCDIYECFIRRRPTSEMTIKEYAGGYLQPYSVRQFLNNRTFDINGTKLESVNGLKTYGGFYKKEISIFQSSSK